MQLFGAGQQVTIRFLNPKSGKPIRKIWISVVQYKGSPPKGPIPADYVVSTVNARTDRNGEVTATLHDPLPTYISVHSFDLSYGGSLLPIDDVLKTGVVMDYSSKGAPQGYWTDDQGQPAMKSGTLLDHSDRKEATTLKVAPEPGVIVFVEKKVTTGERIRQEIP
jgi:hypothetical protein